MNKKKLHHLFTLRNRLTVSLCFITVVIIIIIVVVVLLLLLLLLLSSADSHSILRADVQYKSGLG